ncbi:hypothetical protein BDZ94DRAFT_1320219 [Collybia nuda]|uniref:Uncharacterized protein n=1 Tax=Collybia nuda TaxID=64659 RepID=A0A9P6CGU1_9AGAR|nr:hypothetical protein BDZ94DRAFT_1320219 [Collybia nuda]
MPCISVEEGLLKGLRKIRNIVVDSKDLRTLVDGGKSPASIVDAYAAILQAHAEIGDNPDCQIPKYHPQPLISRVAQTHHHSHKFTLTPPSTNWFITSETQRRWLIINKPQVQKALPKIRIPGGRMSAKAS